MTTECSYAIIFFIHFFYYKYQAIATFYFRITITILGISVNQDYQKNHASNPGTSDKGDSSAMANYFCPLAHLSQILLIEIHPAAQRVLRIYFNH